VRYAEDFPPGARYDLGEHRVTAEEIIRFGRDYDPQPYHLDDELGRASVFGGLIASGWQTCAIWMRLYVTALLPDAAAEGSPGVDEIRFPEPVRPGDVLRGRVEIVGRIPSLSDPGVVVLRHRGELRRADGQIVLTLMFTSRFRRRPRTAPREMGS
jgi:acyl dehydratase